MEMLTALIDELAPPWNKQNMSLLVEEPMVSPSQWEKEISKVTFAQICDVENGFSGLLGHIKSFEGLQIYKPDFEIDFFGHRCNNQFQVGTWVGFCDFSINEVVGNKISVILHDESKMWMVPEFSANFPCCFLHMFCGGFNGWERATRWMECNKLLFIQKEIALDCSEQAMKIWQMRTKGNLFYGKIGINDTCGHKYTGVISTSGQTHWLNICRFAINGFFTCSPPCPSWSRAGRGQGLECSNGLSFSECIAKIRWVRPVAAFFECADKTTSHPHFKILRASLQAAGYKQAWSSVIPYDALAPMCRTRWLAVWIRNDASDVQTLGSFKLCDVQKIGWNSSIYDFPVPSQMSHQMKLTNELCYIYGDAKLLPSSKKLNRPNPSPAEVLTARCISENEPMPTLCAMYSQQHLIDVNHLLGKGIFAALQCVNGKFQFFSPLLCAALLGAVETEPVFIPVKIAPAFLHLGNAISVPHAVLTLAIGFSAIKFIQNSVSQIVLKAWAERLTTTNTIILRSKDFIVMCPLKQIESELPWHNLCDKTTLTNWKLVLGDQELQICIVPQTTILEVFKQVGIEPKALKDFSCCIDENPIPWTSRVFDIQDRCISFVKGKDSFLAFCIAPIRDASECDSLDCAILAEIHQIEAASFSSKRVPLLPCWEPTSIDEPTPKRFCAENPTCELNAQRISLFVHQGIPLATDELDWIIRTLAPKFRLNMCQIAENEWENIEKKIIGITTSCIEKQLIKCMILFDNHWFAIEIRKAQDIEFFCVNAPKKLVPVLFGLFNRCKGINGFKGSFAFSESSFNHGFCGWELVINWFGITFPQFQHHSREILCCIQKNGQIAGPKPNEDRLVALWEIVCSARFHFLSSLPINCCIEGIKIGFANNDQEMNDLDEQGRIAAVDPWLQPSEDPWNQAKKSCKWEDLKLPEDHHFKDGKDKQVAQLHRHQITANTAGIAFATKSCVVDIFGHSPPKQTALLLPNSEKLHFPQMPNLKVTGPFEIVVRDQGLNSIYKRQVLLVQAADEIQFQLPKAAYSATTTEFKELVVEIDERLISKDLSAAIVAKPLETIKAKLLEQIPPLASKSLSVFGFRPVKMQSSKDTHRVFQAICKIQADQRIMCLERSGAGDAFIRDFIPKGGFVDDLTIVPRFWQTDKQAKDEALRMSSSISGFAGLVHTRRGIAVRAWCKHVAAVRKIILAHDERITELNQAVIPRVIRDSTGWPSIVGPQEIVRATNHAVALPPIPTRCYKAQGVTTWTLAFDSAPKIDKFMVQINSNTFEIILTVPTEKPVSNSKAKVTRTAKGNGKGKKEFIPEPRSTPQDDETSQRITSLEAKFSAMERRQDSLEGKINDGFSSVNDQLRQVLHAIQPRGANTQTGMTPPPKIPKTSWWLCLTSFLHAPRAACQGGMHFEFAFGTSSVCDLVKRPILFTGDTLTCILVAFACVFSVMECSRPYVSAHFLLSSGMLTIIRFFCWVWFGFPRFACCLSVV